MVKKAAAPVHDTHRKTHFRIEVTDKDVERAKIGDSYKCVVSQAIARAIPDAAYIETDTQAIRFTRHNQRLVYMTPYAVQGYVIAFDAGDSIQPFSFTLRNPAFTRKTRRTMTGQAAAVAATNARQQTRRKAKRKADRLPILPLSAEVRQAATAAYTAAAADRSEPMTERHGRHAQPRVFKRKMRSYGHRLLRINQQPD